MAKKSAAKIRRNASRAAARGEEYSPPLEEPTSSSIDSDKNGGESDDILLTKSNAAQKLDETLAALPTNLNAKERRSAKRKAEAIAVEESGCSDLTELMEWYARHKSSNISKSKTKKKKSMESITPEIPTQQLLSEEEKAMFDPAKRLHDALSTLESDTNLNAKERRSAKRKAEAIASEETGGKSATELLQWYETMAPPPPTSTSTTNPESNSDNKGKKIPYIIFVGQLSYTTTSDMLYQHFQSTLGYDVIPSAECMKIRLLTDTKTKKSRGMAFIELESPEVMYECLKMHLTHLDGRRINGEYEVLNGIVPSMDASFLTTLSIYDISHVRFCVTISIHITNKLCNITVERSAGGGAATRKARISSFRESQSQYISETIDNILESFTKNGDIDIAKELDEGVIALCKRHSASVVEAALREYVEEKKERKIKYEESLRDGTAAKKTTKKSDGDEDGDEGLEFRNPSAFLTHMIGRIAEEGVGNSSKGGGGGGGSTGRKRNSRDNASGRDGSGRGRSDGGRGGGRGGRGGGADGRGGLLRHTTSSILQQSGVDMSISSRRREGGGDGGAKIERIFPSMARGRGRGRGYM